MLQAQIFIDKDELCGDISLYQFILNFLLEREIAGATAFEGHRGFGSHQKMKRPDAGLSFDSPPMLITFTDKEEKVKATLKELRKTYSGGFITTHAVEQW